MFSGFLTDQPKHIERTMSSTSNSIGADLQRFLAISLVDNPIGLSLKQIIFCRWNWLASAMDLQLRRHASRPTQWRVNRDNSPINISEKRRNSVLKRIYLDSAIEQACRFNPESFLIISTNGVAKIFERGSRVKPDQNHALHFPFFPVFNLPTGFESQRWQEGAIESGYVKHDGTGYLKPS